jgi:hypothetical protein
VAVHIEDADILLVEPSSGSKRALSTREVCSTLGCALEGCPGFDPAGARGSSRPGTLGAASGTPRSTQLNAAERRFPERTRGLVGSKDWTDGLVVRENTDGDAGEYQVVPM